MKTKKNLAHLIARVVGDHLTAKRNGRKINSKLTAELYRELRRRRGPFYFPSPSYILEDFCMYAPGHYYKDRHDHIMYNMPATPKEMQQIEKIFKDRREYIRRALRDCSYLIRKDPLLDPAAEKRSKTANKLFHNPALKIPYRRWSFGGIKLDLIAILESGREFTFYSRDDREENICWHGYWYNGDHGRGQLIASFDQWRNSSVVGGLLTIPADGGDKILETDETPRPCRWVKWNGDQDNRYSWIDGYCAGGYHAKTRAGAIRGLRKRKEAEARYLESCKAAEAEARIKDRAEIEALIAAAGKSGIILTRGDSHAAGNCVPGTAAWGDRHHVGEQISLRSFCALLLLDWRAGRCDQLRSALLAGWQAIRRFNAAKLTA